jgi:oxaloacetate decarboxylase gamma subunit
MSEILVQSVELMFLGMGFVFVFLAVLVVATSAMSNVVMKYFPEPLPQLVAPRRVASQPKGQIDSTTMAVITAAIKQHRSRQKK